MASDKLALAQKIYDAQQLYDKKGSKADANGNGLGSPGVGAMGNDNGPTTAAENTMADKGNAALAGFGQGATGGYMPQLQAATEPMSTKILDLLSGSKIAKANQKLKDMGINDTSEENDTYVNRRDAASKRLKDIQSKNPLSFGAGELGGTAATALALPGGAATEGLTTAQRIARAMGTGAAIGGLQNPGDVEGEVAPVQAIPRLKNAAIGSVAGLAPEATIMGLQKASPMLQKMAQSEAFAALGPYARAARKAVSKGEVGRIGQTALDEGVVGGLPTSYAGLEQRAANAATKRGAELEGYMGDLGAKESRLTGADTPALTTMDQPLPKAGINRKAIADSVREDMISPHTDVPGVAKQNEQVEALLKQFESGDDSVIPVLQAWEKKQAIGKQVNWDRLPGADIPVEEQVNRKLYGKVNQGIKDEAGFIENQPDKGLLPGESDNTSAGKFEKLNNTITDLKRGQGMAQQRHAQELAKKAMLPAMGGLYGLSQGGEHGDMVERLENALKYGGAGYLLNKGLQLSPQVTAPLLQMGSKGAQAGAKGLLKMGAKNQTLLPAISAMEATDQ